jgi:alpha-beta hydrolase superfamily lysophospholipase
MCAALSGLGAGSVNAESLPGVTETIEEWTWLWDDQTRSGELVVPRVYYDRRFGRTYSRGRMTLRYQLRIPENRDEIRGILVLIPGLAQHSGRYRYFVDHFKDDFVIAACDTRHMGRSNAALAEVELGEIPDPRAHRELRSIRKFFYIVYDLDEFLRAALPRHLAMEGIIFEDQSLIIVGHSLGGLVALDYALGNDVNVPPSNLAGIIFSYPARRPPRGVPSLSEKIFINYGFDVNASFGSGTEERTAFMVVYEQVRNLFMTPVFYLASLTRMPAGTEWVAQWVTDDPWEQIGFQMDPLTVRENPINFVYQIQEHIVEIRGAMEAMQDPYLLLLTPRDQIVNPIGAREFAERSLGNHPLNQVHAIPDTYSHEIFRARPAVRERAFAAVEEWIDRLLADPAGH